MKEIYLISGDVCLVSDEDFEELNKHTWHVAKSGNGLPYVYRRIGERVEGKKVSMHAVVVERMGLVITEGFEPDHKDRNGLNNQRDNLRIVTHSVNQQNRNLQSNNTTGVKGVYFDKQRNNWYAQIKVRGVAQTLGHFKTLDEAIEARQKAEKHHGFKPS